MLCVFGSVVTSSSSAVLAQDRDPPVELVFSFREGPGFGFCPEPDTVSAASILFEAPRGHSIRLSVYEVVHIDVGGEDCIPTIEDFDSDNCLISRELPARVLSEAEVATFFGLLEEIEPRLETGLHPLCGSSDPCRVRDFTWEGVRTGDTHCDDPRVTFQDAELIVQALARLRDAGPGPGDPVLENGDVNGDERRDLSDAVYLLNGLFSGGPAPVESGCPAKVVETCPDERLRVRANGDTNGDSVRDLADAVTLLSWLFRAGDEPVPLCECADPPPGPCVDGGCPRGERCIPLWDEFGGPICTSEMSTCDEVIEVYTALVSRSEGACDPAVGCHLVFGHCGVGLGGCYYALPRTVTQEHLDALSQRFIELGGLESCPGPVCRCPAPPKGVRCVDGFCRFGE